MSCSFGTKSAPRISQKPFGLESPNFTQTSIPSTIGRHYLLPIGSYRGKTVENTAFDGFGWNFSRTVQISIMKFYAVIEDKRPHKPAGNDVTSCFQSAFIEVRKTAGNAASDGFGCVTYNNAVCIMQCQISRVKNIDNVCD